MIKKNMYLHSSMYEKIPIIFGQYVYYLVLSTLIVVFFVYKTKGMSKNSTTHGRPNDRCNTYVLHHNALLPHYNKTNILDLSEHDTVINTTCCTSQQYQQVPNRSQTHCRPTKTVRSRDGHVLSSSLIRESNGNGVVLLIYTFS